MNLNTKYFPSHDFPSSGKHMILADEETALITNLLNVSTHACSNSASNDSSSLQMPSSMYSSPARCVSLSSVKSSLSSGINSSNSSNLSNYKYISDSLKDVESVSIQSYVFSDFLIFVHNIFMYIYIQKCM